MLNVCESNEIYWEVTHEKVLSTPIFKTINIV